MLLRSRDGSLVGCATRCLRSLADGSAQRRLELAAVTPSAAAEEDVCVSLLYSSGHGTGQDGWVPLSGTLGDCSSSVATPSLQAVPLPFHSAVPQRGFAAAAAQRPHSWQRPPQQDATRTAPGTPQAASATALGAATPLLRNPPARTSVPLPSLASCPTVAALAAHVQAHGPTYSLAHVAAGLQVLAQLSAPPTTAPTSPNTAPSAPAATSSPLSTTPQSPPLPDHNPPVPPSQAGAAQCARRLAHLGHYQMRKEIDVASLAACIRALAGLGEGAVALAGPFAERLLDSRYYYSLPGQQPGALVAVLRALGRLRARLQASSVDWRKASARVVSCLGSHVASLSAGDAAEVTQAMVRLNVRVLRSRVHTSFMRALTRHLSSELLPQDAVPADLAVRLLCAYGQLLPGVCGPPGSSRRPHGYTAPAATAAPAAPASATTQPGAAPVAATPHSDASSSSSGARSLFRRDGAPEAGKEMEAEAGREEERGSEREDREDRGRERERQEREKEAEAEAVLDGATRREVADAVSELVRVVRRSLGACAPGVLARCCGALAQLGAQREAGALLPQATPLLLQAVEGLDAYSLADVAAAYHSLRVSEPGLMKAVADQLVASASERPLSLRLLRLLLPCYGAGGSAQHPRLRALLRQSLLAGLPGFHPPALAALLPYLDPSDAKDAQLVGLIEARLREAAQGQEPGAAAAVAYPRGCLEAGYTDVAAWKRELEDRARAAAGRN